ncbi:MAG: ligase-associated DNA damage response endonuclease PdeM [Luteolibacter sp.]
MNPISTHLSVSLLAEGAAFLTISSTLIVADIHLGKSAAFRAKGLPVPEGDTARDFARLIELAGKCRASHLVIAGDLFHSPSGITPELETALGDFIHSLGLPVTLVLGNHDAKIRQLPAGLEVLPHLDLEGNIRVIHDPHHAEGEQLSISGHWHPVVKIPDGKRTSLRLPCFLYRNNTLVLPAFGSFTGGAILAAEPNDRVFIALRDQIVELPSTLIS